MLKYRKGIIVLGKIVCIVLIWCIVSYNEVVPTYILPSPKGFSLTFFDFIFGNMNQSPYSGKMFENFIPSFLRILVGFVIACVIGIMCGFLTGYNKIINCIFDPIVQLMRSVPGIAWLPLSMVWFGIGEKNTIFLIGFSAFFPIYLNTYQSIVNTPIEYIQTGKMLGIKERRIISQIVFPLAFPEIKVGLRLGLGASWSFLVLGELTGVNKGIGAVMMDARMMGRIDIVMSCMIIIAVGGKLSDFVLQLICSIYYPAEGVLYEECM